MAIDSEVQKNIITILKQYKGLSEESKNTLLQELGYNTDKLVDLLGGTQMKLVDVFSNFLNTADAEGEGTLEVFSKMLNIGLINDDAFAKASSELSGEEEGSSKNTLQEKRDFIKSIANNGYFSLEKLNPEEQALLFKYIAGVFDAEKLLEEAENYKGTISDIFQTFDVKTTYSGLPKGFQKSDRKFLKEYGIEEKDLLNALRGIGTDIPNEIYNLVTNVSGPSFDLKELTNAELREYQKIFQRAYSVIVAPVVNKALKLGGKIPEYSLRDVSTLISSSRENYNDLCSALGVKDNELSREFRKVEEFAEVLNDIVDIDPTLDKKAINKILMAKGSYAKKDIADFITDIYQLVADPFENIGTSAVEVAEKDEKTGKVIAYQEIKLNIVADHIIEPVRIRYAVSQKKSEDGSYEEEPIKGEEDLYEAVKYVNEHYSDEDKDNDTRFTSSMQTIKDKAKQESKAYNSGVVNQNQDFNIYFGDDAVTKALTDKYEGNERKKLAGYSFFRDLSEYKQYVKETRAAIERFLVFDPRKPVPAEVVEKARENPLPSAAKLLPGTNVQSQAQQQQKKLERSQENSDEGQSISDSALKKELLSSMIEKTLVGDSGKENLLEEEVTPKTGEENSEGQNVDIETEPVSKDSAEGKNDAQAEKIGDDSKADTAEDVNNAEAEVLETEGYEKDPVTEPAPESQNTEEADAAKLDQQIMPEKPKPKLLEGEQDAEIVQ